MSQHGSKRDEMLQDVNARQENVLWPDTVRNTAAVDGYLWKGNPKATKVQRAGSLICGLFVLGIALVCITVAYQGASFNIATAVVLLFGAGFTYLGCRVIRNAFLR
jgi:hypothetical protein